jgi:hypothetical protein
MRHDHRSAAVLLAGFAAALSDVPGAARADVTIEQQVTFDFAFIKSHGTSTEWTTGDKQRRDSEMHCEGFMSMLCGNTQGGEITRLDREVEWTLEPKKKEYRERHLQTAAETQAVQQEAQAMTEKMKQCPAMRSPSAAGPDTSKCEMTTPKFDVKQTGTHATFAGHDAQLTQLAMTESCKNPETGDVCDLVFAFDVWLTQDQVAGFDEQKAFRRAYQQKLGLADDNPLLRKQMSQLLAPYAASLKQLSGKAGDLKGTALKTSVRIAYGGEHCAAAKRQSQSGSGDSTVTDAGQASGDAAGNDVGGTALGSAASAFSSKLVSGLFAKKKSDAAAGTPSASPAGAADSALPPGVVQVAQITVETTSIRLGAVPAPQFDIPAGWKLIEPAPQKVAKEEFSCPKPGS